MNLQQDKTLLRAVQALERIADALEGLLESTNPIKQWTSLDQIPEEAQKERVFFPDEGKDIVREQLRRMGKEPKDL